MQLRSVQRCCGVAVFLVALDLDCERRHARRFVHEQHSAVHARTLLAVLLFCQVLLLLMRALPKVL